MSDDEPDEAADGLEALTPDVSEERPLDALMPEMQKSGLSDGDDPHRDAPTEVDAIHPRVLEVELEGGHEWTLAFWEDPGPEDVRTTLHQLMRATVLKELSRPPRRERTDPRTFLGARTLAFESLREHTRSALRDLGWREESYDPEEYSERLKAWQNEARAAELDVPARPVSIWRLPARRSNPPRSESLDAIAEEMLDVVGDEYWGETPGGLSKLLARGLERRFGVDIEIDAEGLRAMEHQVVPDVPDAISLVRPILFQGLCDFVGVVLHGSFGVRVQWGLCKPDERGLVPPPMFRDPATQHTLPIGRALLDWCVLPDGKSDRDRDIGSRIEELARTLGTDEPPK
jgi:hypothetical protein